MKCQNRKNWAFFHKVRNDEIDFLVKRIDQNISIFMTKLLFAEILPMPEATAMSIGGVVIVALMVVGVLSAHILSRRAALF